MPYIDLASRDDYASIWYTTNSPFGNVGSFEPEKPTIILLHPMFLDSRWHATQFGDPRLDTGYNLIAFDMRVCGMSTARPSGQHDSWVEAADLAFCHQALHLPPAHILAQESLSTNCALRFASLFPEMCLSLTLVNVPPPTELRSTFNAFDGLLKDWCFTSDLDAFFHVGKEAVHFIAGPSCDPDLQDDLISFWAVNSPPFRRQRIAEVVSVILNRTPLTAKTYSNITQPVLVLQAERSETCPMQYAEQLVKDLGHVEGGAILYTVKGGVGCLSIVPGTASIVNQVFVKFISRLPSARSDILQPEISTEERMKSALQKLSELIGDSSIAGRDPLSSLSFSCLAPDVAKSQLETVTFYGKDQWKAFSPLGPDGRPLRKYSDKKDEHWFHSDQDGSSYAGSDIATRQKHSEQELEEVHAFQSSRSEPVTSDVAQDGRMRRTTFSPSSVDKVVIKGSMSKVVASPTHPLQRALLSINGTS